MKVLCVLFFSLAALTAPFQCCVFFIHLRVIFCKKKIVGASGMLWAGGSVRDKMYVTPIRLDLLLNTNQIFFCKGKWYLRRFDPDTVQKAIFILL